MCVVAGDGRTTGDAKLASGPGAERPVALGCGGLQLHLPAERLLEVVARELRVLAGVRAGPILEPPRVPFVKVRTQLLRDQAVRGVADQDVFEAVTLLVREVRRARTDELAADQTLKARIEIPAGFLRKQLRKRRSVEASPLDRRPLDHLALAARKSVDAGCQDRLDRRREGRRGVPELLPERHHLLEEEGVALRGREQLRMFRGGESPPVCKPVQQLVRFSRGELRQAEQRRAIRRLVTPLRAFVEELGTSEAEDQQRDIRREFSEARQQIEKRGLRPMDVLDDHDQRLPLGDPLQQPAHSPLGFSAETAPDEMPVARATKDATRRESSVGVPPPMREASAASLAAAESWRTISATGQ